MNKSDQQNLLAAAEFKSSADVPSMKALPEQPGIDPNEDDKWAESATDSFHADVKKESEKTSDEEEVVAIGTGAAPDNIF